MERHDRAPVGTFFAEAAFVVGETIELGEGAAHHARVKRLEAGDVLRLTDGAGQLAFGSIVSAGKGSLLAEISRVDGVVAPPPIHLLVPVADRDRMLWLAEKATELGVTSWQPVRFRRSMSVSPRGEGPAFAEKVKARMINALEQSGGAWLPRVLPDVTVEHSCATDGAIGILLDVGGDSLPSFIAKHAGAVRLALGPEGGIEPDELALFDAAGWKRARLAPATLRFETAGMAAVAVLRSLLSLDGGRTNGR